MHVEFPPSTNGTEERDKNQLFTDTNAIYENVSPETKDCVVDLLELPEMSSAMRRVDWRWAVAKGYLNKDTHEWNENMGGKKAYLKQRNDRMRSRYWAVQLILYKFLCIMFQFLVAVQTPISAVLAVVAVANPKFDAHAFLFYHALV
jgi:hypothetical protein